MANTLTMKQIVSSSSQIALAVIFSAQSLWAQAPVNTTTVAVPTAPVEVTRKYSGSIKVTTLGRGIEDKNLKSRVGWTFVEAGVDTEFSEWLQFNIGVVGVFGEGAAQNYLSDEGGGSSALILDAAGVVVKPFKQLSLKAGVIGFQINPIYTTMSPGTSLGAEQKLEFATSNEAFKLAFIGNEAVPSTGVTKGLVQEEKNPFFVSGSVMTELKAKAIKTKLKIAGTQYQFGNLPKAQAANSLTSGNSVNSVEGSGGEMHYVIGFAGTEAAAQLETEWTSKVKTTLRGVMIRNNEAFENQNEGKMARFDLRVVFGNVAVKPSVTVFEVEADTTPANYTILSSRYNNRKGQMAGLSVELIKQKVFFFGNYTKANVIEASPYISDRELFNVGVEVNYDLF